MAEGLRIKRPGGMTLAGLVLLLAAVTARAADTDPQTGKPVPADTAILELLLPAGAQVTLDGADRGTQRRFSIQSLKPGKEASHDVRVRFAGGEEQHRVVELHSGWYVRLPLQPANTARPELALQTGHAGEVLSVAFSPDGQRLLTGSRDQTVALWDAQTGEQLRQLKGHTASVTSVAFSPDGRRLLTGSSDQTAILWDAQTGELLRELKGHTGKLTSVAFAPDGRRLLTGSSDRTAILWDTQTGERLREFKGHSRPVTCVTLSPDGRRLLTGSWDQTAVLWDAATGERLRDFKGHTREVTSVAFSPDGRRLLTGSKDRTALLWDAQTGEHLLELKGHVNTVTSVAFHPDGGGLLTSSDDYTAALWDAQTGRKLREFKGHHGGLSSAAFSPDGRRLLTGSDDQTAALWDAQTGERLRQLKGHTRMVTAMAVSPDGRRLLVGSLNKAALCDARTGEPLYQLEGDTGRVDAVAFSPDGRRLLTGSRDRAVLWDAETGERLRDFKGHTDAVTSAAFSPDGRRLLTGSFDQTATLWNAETGERLREFKGHTNAVTSVAFTPNGRSLLTGSLDKTAVLWDAQTGGRLREFKGHTNGVTSVAMSPDGRRLLTGSWDQTAVLWDAETGERLRQLKGHAERVTSVAFSPDGRRLLTASADGTTRVWDVATGEELARLLSLDEGQDWLVVTPDGLFDGSAGGRQLVSYRVGGSTPVPVDRFFQDFYRPGLLAALCRGERLLPAVAFAKYRPPTLHITAPQPGGSAASPRVTIEVEAVDEGGGVEGPWLVHNGARVPVPGRAEKMDQTVRRRFEVALIEGENRLEVRAATADRSWESEPAVLTLRYDRPLDKPRLYLLAVGVNRYAQESMNLKFAAADARALCDLFQKRGPALYREVVPMPLPDEQATKTGILKALDDIARQARPQDTLVVFLAGHGTAIDKNYYFIPHEFRRGKDKTPEDDVRQQGLPVDVLGKQLGRIPALKRVLVLDTCEAGGALGRGPMASNPFDFQGEVVRLGRNQGVFTIGAAAAGEEAQEVAELGHGVLTYALLAGLGAVERGPLAGKAVQPIDPGGVVSVMEWFTFAVGHVPRLTKQYFGRDQEPPIGTAGTSFPVLPVTGP